MLLTGLMSSIEDELGFRNAPAVQIRASAAAQDLPGLAIFVTACALVS